MSMRDFAKGIAALTPAFAMASVASAGTEPPRALALDVVESGDSVEVQLIANSPVTQQVEYQLELVGNSRARHSGNTSVPAGNRQVLSKLTANFSESWCATVEVTEASGASYTLTAGDCSEI